MHADPSGRPRLVYKNMLMLQDVLADQPWVGLLAPADRRGLTPLFRTHVRPTAKFTST